MSHGVGLPFTTGEFLDVFVRYHHAVGPAPLIAFAAALVAVVSCFVRPVAHNRVAWLILAALWVWVGAVYHLRFFAAINPAARIFGAMFIVQGALFVWEGVIRQRLRFEPATGSPANRRLGVLVVLYAFLGYPLIGLLVGHTYPAAPTFGLPCPTVIFTFGLLIWTQWQLPLYVIVIPALWSVMGTVAAVQLSMWEDFGLLAAAITAVAVVLHSRRSHPIETSRPQRPLLAS